MYDFKVLLDTGSEELWLMDHSCKSCTFTLSLCPHLKFNSKTIALNYFSGRIEGKVSYLNFCGNNIEFICATNQTGFDILTSEVHGILGLKGNSTGVIFFKTILKEFFNIDVTVFSIYKNRNTNQHKLIIGAIPEYYHPQRNFSP